MTHSNNIKFTNIDNTVGDIDIQIRNQEIVRETDILVIVHIIDIKQIEKIINEMTDNINLINIIHKDISTRIVSSRNKLLTLIPISSRQKRELINAISSMSK